MLNADDQKHSELPQRRRPSLDADEADEKNGRHRQQAQTEESDMSGTHNLWDVTASGMCTGYNVALSYIQPYLLNSSFGNNTSGIGSVLSFNNVEFWNSERVSMLFRCGGYLSESGQKLSRVDGCVLETNDWFQLPYIGQLVYGSAIVYSHMHGLIVCGGRNDDDVAVDSMQHLVAGDNAKILKWQALPSMHTARYCPSICLWEDMKAINYHESELLIVAGGCNETDGDLNTCSIYDFHSGEWNEISSTNVARSCSTLVHWKYRNKCVIVGGSNNACKSVEQYDLIKDTWVTLPTLNEPHRNYPCVWIDNSLLYGSYHGLLCVCGDGAKKDAQHMQDGLGHIEILDVRDSANKWQTVAHLSSFFMNDEYKTKYCRRLVCC